MRNSFNYRNIFKKPIVIPSLDFWQFNTPLELRRVTVGAAVVVVLWLIRWLLLARLFPVFFSHQLVMMLYFIVPTYYLSGVLSEEHPFFDEKNIFFFLRDYLRYFWAIRLQRVRYCQDQKVVLDKRIRFKKKKL